MRSALLAGGVLAFALSFDEIVVTTFTAGAGIETLPQWIFNNLFRPNQLPIVNVVATFVVLRSIIPVLPYRSERRPAGYRRPLEVRSSSRVLHHDRPVPKLASGRGRLNSSGHFLGVAYRAQATRLRRTPLVLLGMSAVMRAYRSRQCVHGTVGRATAKSCNPITPCCCGIAARNRGDESSWGMFDPSRRARADAATRPHETGMLGQFSRWCQPASTRPWRVSAPSNDTPLC